MQKRAFIEQNLLFLWHLHIQAFNCISARIYYFVRTGKKDHFVDKIICQFKYAFCAIIEVVDRILVIISMVFSENKCALLAIYRTRELCFRVALAKHRSSEFDLIEKYLEVVVLALPEKTFYI